MYKKSYMFAFFQSCAMFINMNYHIEISILIGFFLDCILGDPHFFVHPVKIMGASISFLEKKLNIPGDSPQKQKFKGLFLVLLLFFPSFLLPLAFIFLAQAINPIFSLVIESIMCYQCIAARSLCHESMKVHKELKKNDINAARKALSMIVGRDTDILDEKGITKAAVETVAENTNDGVVAPLFFIFLFGTAGGMVYKAINTMDSMIAYKNERFKNFGFCAAKLDDLANFIPARISALLMIIASILPGFSFTNAVKIFIRDRHKHASPNSAQTESVCAGALQIQLAGSAVYGGIVEKKEFIGDKIREIEIKDIPRSNFLMYATTILTLAIGESLRFLLN